MKAKVVEVGRNWVLLENENGQFKRSVKASDAEKLQNFVGQEIEYEEKNGLLLPKI